MSNNVYTWLWRTTQLNCFLIAIELLMLQDIRGRKQNQAVLRVVGGGLLAQGGRGHHVQRGHEEPPRTHAVLPLLQRLLLVLLIAHVP